MTMIGSYDGSIRIFDKEEQEVKVLNVPDKKGENVTNAVISMDIHPKDSEYLVAGYKNGNVVLWDLQQFKPLKIVNDIHKTQTLSVKFINYNNLHTIASD